MKLQLWDMLTAAIKYDELQRYLGGLAGKKWAIKYATESELTNFDEIFGSKQGIESFLGFIDDSGYSFQEYLPIFISYHLYKDDSKKLFWDRAFSYCLWEIPELEDSFVLGFIEGAFRVYEDKQLELIKLQNKAA